LFSVVAICKAHGIDPWAYHYEVTVPAHGRAGFVEGPAEGEAIVRDRGTVTDTQEWSRAVELAIEP
jgi:hypothetical protein